MRFLQRTASRLALFGLVVGLTWFTARGLAQPLIELGENWRLTNATPELATNITWRTADFTDTAWYLAPSGFGNTAYGENTRYDTAPGDWSNVLFRKTFSVADPSTIHDLILRADYTSGLLVYLNGEEVARRGLPPVLTMPEVPFDFVPVYRNYGNAEVIPLTIRPGLVRLGTNQLAVRVKDSFSRRPVLVPELLANFIRTPYLQLITSNSASVLWRTPSPVTGRLELGTGNSNSFPLHFSSAAAATNQEIAASNLLPDTLYRYRVLLTNENGPLIVATNSFRTLRAAGNLTVAVFGDSGWGSPAQYAVARQLQRSGADLLLHTGDIVYPGFTSGLADTRFLGVYRHLLESTAFYSVWGNHDFLYSWEWNGPYRDTIRLPSTTVSSAELSSERAWPGAYYSFDAGDVHFAMLFLPLASVHTLAPTSPQYKWLDADLAATTKPWKILLQHHPVFTSSAHRRDLYGKPPLGFYDPHLVRANLLPLAKKHGVQLICSGHDHGYERFLPVDGVHTLVTGGGGAGLYGVLEYDELNSQFHAQFHYTRLFFEGDTLRVRAVGTSGANFDGFNIHRAASPAVVNDATWMTPAIEDTSGTLDGNHPGQSYELFTAGVADAKTGSFGNLGRMRVALDKTNLYLGLEFILLPPDSDVYLFVESPRQVGVSSLAGLGNGVMDPAGEGVDAVDFLENLSFADFQPSVVAVLGDEYADGNFRGWARTTYGPALGEGIFRLGAGLLSVPGARLQQYNRSPQDTSVPPERNADFVEIAIPRSELGAIESGDILQIGAVIGGGRLDPVAQSRNLDTGFLGESFVLGDSGRGVLKGVRFRLPADPDPDSDGLDAAQELAAKTDPNNPDTDHDGLADGWEVTHGLNPLSADGANGADGDMDSDGFTNREEFRNGTRPDDPGSPPPGLQSQRNADGTVTLAWKTQMGRRYALQSASLAPGLFQLVESFPRTATGTTDQYRVTPSAAAQYFRITVLP